MWNCFGAWYFNTSYVSVLLRRFRNSFFPTFRFQYIVCFGSTFVYANMNGGKVKFQYIVCFGSTTIIKQGNIAVLGFQYIVCFGSTEIILEHTRLAKDFNTSYVSVLHFCWNGVELWQQYFNTSYVSVLLVYLICKPITTLISIHRMFRFYPFKLRGAKDGLQISIHRMFRFYNKFPTDRAKTLQNFNTSYVSVLRC